MTHTNLRSLFTDIANAVRAKTGSSAPIVADAFPSAIADIPTGGGGSEELDGLIMRTLTSFTGSQSYIDTYAFTGCSSLTTVSFPVCTNIGSNAFFVCSKLSMVSFPECTNINTYAFASCSSLIEITVGTDYSSVCYLSNSNAFSKCSALTSIYVPASLLTAYQTSTNWTYYSSKLVGV